jgi:hypothetical protein
MKDRIQMTVLGLMEKRDSLDVVGMIMKKGENYL